MATYIVGTIVPLVGCDVTVKSGGEHVTEASEKTAL